MGSEHERAQLTYFKMKFDKEFILLLYSGAVLIFLLLLLWWSWQCQGC
jgi:hypothetical protein